MLSTKNFYPKTTGQTVTVDEDGTVTISIAERVTREHTSGRKKGMVEHVIVNLHFDDVDDARAWFAEGQGKLP